jgi:hypothetical protein
VPSFVRDELERRWDSATATMIDEARSDVERGILPEVTLERMQGWAAHEAIAAAVYLVARHSGKTRARERPRKSGPTPQ